MFHKSLSPKQVTAISGAVIGAAGVVGLGWTYVAVPQMDDRYIKVETAQESIARQYEDQGKIISKVFEEIDSKANRARRDDLYLRLDLNLLEQKFLSNLPTAERTTRDDVRLRFLEDQQRRISDEIRGLE